MNVLENDTRSLELTPEFVVKSDLDIETIKSLEVFASRTGNILVLSSGYATEALCGGKITRPHGDLDAHFILTGSVATEELFDGVGKLLSKEKTKWKLRDKKADKIEYVEVDKGKDFFSKRRVEVRLNEPHEHNVKYPKKKLIDSQGSEIEVHVVDATEMVRQKVAKFYELKDHVDTSQDRHTSMSDIYDLKRLLVSAEVDPPAIRSEKPEEYDYVISLLNSVSKGKIA